MPIALRGRIIPPHERDIGKSDDGVKLQADELAGRVSHATLVRRDEPLAKRTTLRVGGPADLYVEPASEEDLAAVVKFCAGRKLPFFVLGPGFKFAGE